MSGLDEPALTEITDMLEEINLTSYFEVNRIWNLPGTSWAMYDVMKIKDLAEQKLLSEALPIFKTQLIKAMKYAKSNCNPKNLIGLTIQSSEG